MNGSRIVTLDMTADDYEELLALLRTCSDVTAKMSDGNPEFYDLSVDLRYFCDNLLKGGKL